MMKKRVISIMIFLQVILLALGVVIFSSQKPSLAPQTVAAEAEEVVKMSAPEDLSDLQSAGSAQLDYWSKSLSRFDGRDYNYITPEHNQGSLGICWSYAAIGAIEANILRDGVDPQANKDNLNLDEIITAYARYNNDGTNDPLMLTTNDTFSSDDWRMSGGHADDAFMTMTQGYGLQEQQTASNYSDSQIKPLVGQSKYIVKGFKQINKSPEAIKRAILEYGAVTMEYKAPQTTKQTYLYYDDGTSLGHASIIVGWDDSIQKNLFWPGTASSNGGWIVKNSWGSGGNEVNNTCCFYLSYNSYLSNNLFVVETDLNEKYPNIYHYDGNVTDNGTNYITEATGVIYEAKLSSATQQEKLTAVSFGVRNSEVTVDIEIYKLSDVNPGDVNSPANIPDGGTLIAEKRDIYFADDGFYTVDLDQPVPLEQGEYFSIVISGSDTHGNPVFPYCAAETMESINDMSYRKYLNKWTSMKGESGTYADSNNGMSLRLRAITTLEDRPQPLDNNLKNARIELSTRFMYYEKNRAQKPEITVWFGDRILEENQDYLVEITNNYKPGSVNVTIKGMNEYSGTRTTVFEIAKPKYPPGVMGDVITVYNNVTRLYQISLPNDWEWVDNDYTLENGLSSFSHAMRYVGDDADCYRYTSRSVKIEKLSEPPPDAVDISTATVEIVGEYYYTSLPITPKVMVKVNGIQLRAGVDYILACQNNINAGMATLTVTGEGQFKGQKTLTFEIKQADWPQNRPDSVIRVGRGTTTLSQVDLRCKDWSWQNPSLVIFGSSMTAIAVYNGSDKQNFVNTQMQIVIEVDSSKNIASISVRLESATFVYNGAKIEPAVLAEDGAKTLQKGVDFLVTYSNNQNAGQASATIEGIGDYFGFVTLNFEIQRANRPSFSVTQQDWTYGDTPPSPSVTGNEGGGTITYLYSNSQDGAYSSVKPSNAGTYWIKAIIAQTQNYNQAESVAKFVISPKSVSMLSKKVEGEPFTYTGKAITPKITVKDGGKTLIEGVDFTIEFQSNIDAGLALATIKGQNDYSGTYGLLFEIKQAPASSINKQIHITQKFEKLSDVKLPADFVWKEDSLKYISSTRAKATAIYTGHNYDVESIEFEIIIDEAPSQPSAKSNNLIWLSVVVPIVTLALVWIIIEIVMRKRSKWR